LKIPIEEKRKELHSVFYSLDYLETYKLTLELLEEFPAEHSICSHFKDLSQFMYSGYRDKFDLQRCMRALDACIRENSSSPLVHECKSMLYKLEKNYPLAEEHAFRAAYLNGKSGDLPIHRNLLFELAYVWKNMGKMDTFIRLTFSIPWNMMLFKGFRQVAFPDEILKKRIFTLDFGKSPAQNAALIRQSEARFFLVSAGCGKRDSKELLRYLSVFSKQNIEFDVYHMLSREETLVFDRDVSSTLSFRIPKDVTECPAAVRIEGYTLVICPQFEALVRPILERIDTLWSIKVEKSTFCTC
jgi:hypothetical protein